MKLEYECGCSINAEPDGTGGIDATFVNLCKKHNEEYGASNK